jgi:hypothetical protein
MSRSWGARRRELFGSASREAAPAPVGRDFAEKRRPRLFPRLPYLPILVGAVLAGLVLTSLRTAIVRTRYALGDAIEKEQVLLERERSAAVEVRQRRDPRRLREAALAQGFGRPERVIALPSPERRP